MRTRPPASPAERALARQVAHFVSARCPPGKHLDALTALACISGAFPGVTLDTAIVGYLFREMLIRKERRLLQ
jgi:hypothetical protein